MGDTSTPADSTRDKALYFVHTRSVSSHPFDCAEFTIVAARSGMEAQYMVVDSTNVLVTCEPLTVKHIEEHFLCVALLVSPY